MKTGIYWHCGLASGFACLYSSSLPPCRSGWQCSPTTPVPRLQKPSLQFLRECQLARAFPLLGRTHRHTAMLLFLAKFLSCFAFFLSSYFSPNFLTPASFMALFSASNTFLCFHIALQVSSIASFFPSSPFYSSWFSWTLPSVIFCFITNLNTYIWHSSHSHWFCSYAVRNPGHVCFYLHVLACYRQKKCRQECKLCLVWIVNVSSSMSLTRSHWGFYKRIRCQVVCVCLYSKFLVLHSLFTFLYFSAQPAFWFTLL